MTNINSAIAIYIRNMESRNRALQSMVTRLNNEISDIRLELDGVKDELALCKEEGKESIPAMEASNGH